MIEGVRARALAARLIDDAHFDAGIRALHRTTEPDAENDDPPRVAHVPRPRSTRGVSGRRLAMSTGAHAMQVPSDARHFLRASRSIMEIMLGFDSVVITWPIRETKRRSCTWRSIASAKSIRAVNRPGPRASVRE
jgi:hypothetical protein